MIGLFDSGSGGLSVLSEIRKLMPKVDVVYLGDIRNAPYGSKSKEELNALVVMLIEKLLREGATKIVSACNSVSASIVLPNIVGMVSPTVRMLKDEKRKILLVGTKATVESGIYQQGFATVGKSIETLAIPELAGAIEFGESDEKIEKIILNYLKTINDLDYEILILGCTHYPLVKDLFEKVLKKLKKNAEIFDPAVAVSEKVKTWKNELGSGKIRFLITEDSTFFRDRVKKMFGSENINIEVI